MTARAATAAATRERIVRAACAVYARVGFRNASMLAVGREADVSPNTVLNHFATPEALLAAVIDLLSSELGLPAPRAVAAAGDLAARVALLAREIAALYVRNEKWWRVFANEHQLPALQAANAAFFRRVEGLVRVALGRGRRDRGTVAVAMTLIGPPTMLGLRARGMTPAAAADTVVELLLGWLERRAR